MKPVIQKIVVAGVLINDNKVLIIQRAENDSFPGLWEIPSGGREPLEKTTEGVKREVKEETGLDVEVDSPVGVFDFTNEREDAIRDATQISFLVKPVGKLEVKLSNEHQAFAWVTKEELDNYNLSPETKQIILKAF